MRSRIAAPCLAAAALLASAPSAAASFAYLAQQRHVSLEDVARATEQRIDAADFAPFAASLGGDDVTQTSSLDPSRILATTQHAVTARTRAETGDVNDHFVVESSFSVDFELDETSPFELDAELAVLGYVTDIAEMFPWWELQLVLETSLVGPGGAVFAAAFDLQADCAFQQDCSFTRPLAASGVLAPGAYTLLARSYAELEADVVCIGSLCGGTAIGSATDGLASVDLRLVPEPGSAALVALGLALLSARGRVPHR